MILEDLILDRENPWAALYDPGRMKPLAAAKDFVKENANVALHFVGEEVAQVVRELLGRLGWAP